MNARECHSHALVGESEEPTSASFDAIGKVQAKSLYQQRIGDLLRNQGTSRLKIAHLAQHTFYCPPYGLPVRLILQQDDWR